MCDYLAWKCRRLGDVVALVGGNSFPERFQGGSYGDIPFFKVSDMSSAGNEKFLARANNYVSRKLAASQGWSLVPPSSVAFAKVGAALLLNRRRITATDSLVDNNMMAAVPGVEIHPIWLYWWLQTVDFGVFVQPGALPSVNQEHLRSLRVLLPSYSEQSRIAAVLDTVDEAIAKTEAVIAKLKQVRAGLLHDLLTRGLDEHGQLRDPIAHPEQFQDSPLGRIPFEWRVLRLSDVAERVQDGTHFSPKTTSGPRRYLTSKNVRFGFLDLNDCGWISEAEHQEIFRRCDVRKDDILLTKDGANTGNASLNTLDEEFSLLSSVALIRCRPGLSHHDFFLNYLLSPMGQKRLKDLMSGNAITRLTLQKIKNFTVPLPPFEEQIWIAKQIEEFRSSIESTEREKVKFHQLKSGLMSDLLTGLVRVPESISVVENQP